MRNKKDVKPPQWLITFFRWYCHPDYQEDIEGDLRERFDRAVDEKGVNAARWQFCKDVIRLFRPGLMKPIRHHYQSNHLAMISNYFKVGWRNITHKKVYAAIHVLGLALGLCAGIVIYTVVSYELSFDTFHPDNERIYRVMGDVTESTGDKLHFARVPLPVSLMGRSELSGLDEIAGIIPYNAPISIPDGKEKAKHFESRINGTHYLTTAITEPQYFEIFRYKWLAGNAFTALENPFSIVLTESRAYQYFGPESLDNILGKQVIYEDSLVVTVSGIVKEWDGNTDLSFTDFISFSTLQSNFLRKRINTDSWGQRSMSAWVFTKLDSSTDPARVTTQMEALVEKHADPETQLALWLEPLSDIHFDADVIENPIRTAHMPTLYSLMAIALFIIILAILNFIILSTAQSMQRAKEVGVRKVLGSGKTSLVFQFWTETLILTFLSVLLAVALVKPVLDLFQSFIPTGISFHLLAPSTILFLGIVTITTSIAAGLYPALVLSSYQPIRSLKGLGAQIGGEKWLLRKGLITFQFTVSLIFIIGSVVVANQLRYTREKDLGFTSDAIITIESPWGDGLSKIDVLAQKINQIPDVDKVALQWLSPMSDNPRGMKLKLNHSDEHDFWVTQVAGNEAFIPLYEIKLLAGRNLLPADTVKELVINESLSRQIGNEIPEEAIGKILYWNDKPYPVVGVVADFHTSSLHDPITPLCIINRPEREGNLAVKLASKGQQSDMIRNTLSQIEKAWKQVYPAETFNYRFYDESLALLYQKDQQTATVINTSMAIAIFISCIGLFGLMLYTAERKAKEISIRKILGASITHIATMLSREFVVLVIIALFVASPIAWYMMSQWLEGFAYHVHIHWWVFALSGTSALGIALATVSFQAIKAALANPVDSLKNE